MLILMQLIDRMLYLEYTQSEIEQSFLEAGKGTLPLELLADAIDVDLTGSQLERAYAALPKVESAIKACILLANRGPEK